MGEQIAAVLMVLAVRNGQPYFVQSGGPAQQSLVFFAGQTPGCCDLLQKLGDGGFDPGGLRTVDLITLRETADRALAHVFLVNATE